MDGGKTVIEFIASVRVRTKLILHFQSLVPPSVIVHAIVGQLLRFLRVEINLKSVMVFTKLAI